MTNININKQIQILINQFNTKNYSHVILKAIELIKTNTYNIILYNLLGSSYQNLGNFLEAKNTFKEGLKIDPHNVSLLNNLAMSYKNLLEYKTSEDLYNRILEKNKNYINAYVNLGNLKRDLNQFNEAILLYEKALQISNKNPIVYYSLALANQGLGKFDEAIDLAKKVLDIDPNFTRADYLISQSMKYNKDNEHYVSLVNKVKSLDLVDDQKIDLYFSLAKAEEDIGNIKIASEYLIKGNNIKKNLDNYKISDEITLLEDIKKQFKKVNLKNSNLNYDKMIFILGMPRSGTSLVEQIITSHSEVFGAGELPILSKIIKDNFIKDGKFYTDNFNNIINDVSKIDSLKKNYENYIKYFDVKEKFITDKAPLNFRWIGFIKMIFPNSKIIHCTRDPKNNCLSMFKNFFEGGLNFTYDQHDLVEYFKHYISLMDFWKTLFGEAIYEIRYENLINNNHEEIKNLIQFCDLNWEENCLSFYQNKSPIKTMSAAQARKPIYNSSVNSFDRYKNYLNILEKKL
jgi:tetratricopeptide (TPR) repeat protein